MRLVFFVWKMIEYLILNSFSLFYGWHRLNVVSLWCMCVYDWLVWSILYKQVMESSLHFDVIVMRDER